MRVKNHVIHSIPIQCNQTLILLLKIIKISKEMAGLTFSILIQHKWMSHQKLTLFNSFKININNNNKNNKISINNIKISSLNKTMANMTNMLKIIKMILTHNKIKMLMKIKIINSHNKGIINMNNLNQITTNMNKLNQVTTNMKIKKVYIFNNLDNIGD